MSNVRAEQLIKELLTDAAKFDREGRAHALLQEYFAGLPLDTLRPLLKSVDPLVQRAAVYVASELGAQAGILARDVVGLLNSNDRYVKYQAIEIVAVCASAERADLFAHVVKEVDDRDNVLRGLAMRLVARADVSQLEAARRVLIETKAAAAEHVSGLDVLCSGESIDPEIIDAMITSEDPLTRRYGAVAAVRMSQRHPQLIEKVKRSDDEDLPSFAERIAG